MNFKIWFENLVAKTNGIKGTVLDFLKDKLNIQDDEAILSMPLGSIDNSVVKELLSRGMIQNASENLLNDIKNGTLTVGDMVERLAGEDSNQFLIPQNKTDSQSGYNAV